MKQMDEEAASGLPREFVVYWKPAMVSKTIGSGPLDEIWGGHLKRNSPGDVLWIVTSRKGGLTLAGRFVVGKMIKRDAKVKVGCAESMREVDIRSRAPDLRFVSPTSDRLII